MLATMTQLLLFSLIVQSFITSALAFTAYDCIHTNASATMIDLTAPEPCTVRNYGKVTTHRARVHVLHEATAMRISGFRCKATFTREIHRCNYNSLHYGMRYMAYDKAVPILPMQCNQLVETGKINLRNKNFDTGKGYRAVLME